MCTAVHCAEVSIPVLLSTAWLPSTSAVFHCFSAFSLSIPIWRSSGKSQQDIPTSYRPPGKLQAERPKMLYRATRSIHYSDHLFFLFRHLFIPVSQMLMHMLWILSTKNISGKFIPQE